MVRFEQSYKTRKDETVPTFDTHTIFFLNGNPVSDLVMINVLEKQRERVPVLFFPPSPNPTVENVSSPFLYSPNPSPPQQVQAPTTDDGFEVQNLFDEDHPDLDLDVLQKLMNDSNNMADSFMSDG
jgi:hypothetical protein